MEKKLYRITDYALLRVTEPRQMLTFNTISAMGVKQYICDYTTLDAKNSTVWFTDFRP